MQYQAPDSFDAAVSLLNAEAGMARVLAGGTDVLVQLRSGAVEPDLLVETSFEQRLYHRRTQHR